MRHVVWAMLAMASFAVLGPAFAEPARRAKIATSLPASIFMAEMTWPEVAKALRQGKRAVIIPTGGLEQRGPHLVTGKHNYIVRRTAQAVARGLGNALVAPVVVYVPEGPIDPPQGHMAFPGAVSLPAPVFQAMLEYFTRSFKAHGFTDILLLGESGGNQRSQQAVADKLNQDWAGTDARVLHVSDYYDAAAKGGHADLRDTSELMAAFPRGVRSGMIGKVGTNGGATGSIGDATGASAT
jgi:creatinine amidohydrolase